MKTRALLTMVVGMAAFSACTNTDLYDPSFIQKQKTSDYETAFTQKFGTFPQNQSWDFSTGMISYASTRAAGDIEPQVASDWYYVEPSTIDFMENKLVEGQNNRAMGNPFIMSVPNNGFGIVPIYQGAAAWSWDLHMVVEQGGEVIEDVLVWEKHRDMQCQLTDEQLEYDVDPTKKLSLYDGKNFKEEFGWERDGDTWYTTKQAFGLHDSHVEYLGGADWGGHNPGEKGWWENYEVGWNTTLAKAVRTKFINFENLPVGASIYFYLDVWTDSEKKGIQEVGDRKESSLNKMMVALTDAPRPSNIDPKNEITIIGCEDNSDESSDWDMNDLVFMVVGYPDVPKPVVIKDSKYDEIIVSKRYMVEDLGTTDDFDFNDIVVDVEQYNTREITLVNGAKVKDDIIATGQRAKVRAMGGTIDFTLKIGDTTWGKKANGYTSTIMYNTEANMHNVELGTPAEFDVTGWIPEKNNISVTVNSGTSKGVIVTYPENGSIPMIIATDTNIDWMDERESVTKEWLLHPFNK